MSPQSRVPFASEITVSCPSGDYGGSSCNACSSSPLSVAEMAWDEEASYVVHKIMGSSSDVETEVPVPRGKRGSDFISSVESSSELQPFLSSYGSAFLSGIFADIAEALTGDEASDGRDSSSGSYERVPKRSRTSNEATFGAPTKSFMALDTYPDGSAPSLSSPTIVSPRSNKSAIKIELFNDQVRELQNLAFPSLPGLPAAVSSSSCSSAIFRVVTPRDGESDQDQESFGWFVATDADDDSNDDAAQGPMFLPHPKSSLAFQVPVISIVQVGETVDVEVQQALAADTIDDVLGDLF